MLKNSLRSGVIAGVITMAATFSSQDVVAQTVAQVHAALVGAKVYKFGYSLQGQWEVLDVYTVTPTGITPDPTQSKPHRLGSTQFQYERHAPASYHTTDPIRSDLYDGGLSSLELDKNFSPVAPGSAKLISTTISIPSALKNALTGTPTRPSLPRSTTPSSPRTGPATHPSGHLTLDQMRRDPSIPSDVFTAIGMVEAMPAYHKSFLVISKTDCRAYLMRQDADKNITLVDNFPVLLGKDKNDRKISNINFSTPGGTYILRRYRADADTRKDYGGNGHFWVLEPTSPDIGYNNKAFELGIHDAYLGYEPGEIPRKDNLADNDPTNNRKSNGCVNTLGKIGLIEHELKPSISEYAIVIVTPEPINQ